MRKIVLFLFFCAINFSLFAQKNNLLLVETESFSNKGGWVIDQQSMDVMGSPFLMAHGMGIPVKDAETSITFKKTGTYRVFVRTRNWTALWSSTDAPGKFQLSINKQLLPTVFGTNGDEWAWQDGGVVTISDKTTTLSLKDLTGFNGRCDAILFSSDLAYKPTNDLSKIEHLRSTLNKETAKVSSAGKYDFVVIGGGMAGVCSAISAARLGLKVALIHDRPVLGGNNSSEVRVHLGGRIRVTPYPNIGNLVNEIGPLKHGNAQPFAYYEDDKKMSAVLAEKNISLFQSFRANAVKMKDGKIESIEAESIETGLKKSFKAPLFADCTGDATIGFLAGAKFMMGREGKSEYGEKRAPETADLMTMGSSVQWFAKTVEGQSEFPDIKWGLPWSEKKLARITRGDWDWETGMNKNQVTDIEHIRDYGMLVVYSNWSFLKNHSLVKDKFAAKQLEWVAYIAGKRESRRLIGDYILTETDLHERRVYPDGTAPTTWTIDLHYPDPENTKLFPENEYKSIAIHTPIYPYPIPFRSLYSVNVPNLMMAGRNISVTHVALGTVRLMRTTGMMGEVLGMAASIAKKHNATPREIYKLYLPELVALMEKGVGNSALPNVQTYNPGDTLMK